MNCPAHGLTCHFSRPLVCFITVFMSVGLLRAVIMSYKSCIPSISSTLPRINVYFRKKSVSFILNEILKLFLRSFKHFFRFLFKP